MFATMFTKSELMDAATQIGISQKETGGYFGGLKSSWNLIGSFLGPLISPNVYMLVGFDYAWLLMGVIQIIFVIFFIYTTRSTENPHYRVNRLEVEIPELKTTPLKI